MCPHYRLLTIGVLFTLTLTAFASSRYPIERSEDPSVALTVTMVKRQPPAFVGETAVRVFVRLTNRSASKIFLESFDLSQRKRDSALLHDVFEQEACPEKLIGESAGRESPLGYSRIHTFSILEIVPGDSISFSIPVDHLERRRCVRLRYWSGESASPRNGSAYKYVYFRPKGSWLPKPR